MELSEYFRLKQKYEARLAQKKAQIRANPTIGDKEKHQTYEMFKRECVNCKKEGGTIFSTDKEHYLARCNATSRCSLDVKIPRTIVYSVREQERRLQDEVIRLKRELIATMLEYEFKFVDKDNTVRRGKASEEELLTATNDLIAVRKLLETSTSQQVTKLEAMLHAEYTALRESDKGHADRYVTILRPLLEQLREAKYKYTAVERNDTGESTLVQQSHPLDHYYR